MGKRTKIIVTGGAGFIGSNIVDKLIEMGHTVIVIDNESTDAHENFYWNNAAQNYKIDICDYHAIKPLFKDVEYVFHLAAEARIQPTLENPILATQTNAVGTCTVLQCAKEAGVKRVIYSSTSSAYGLKNAIPNEETMPKDCLNPYSVTKTCGEELCKMYTNLFGLETVIFRYFNVYGDRQPMKGQYAPVIGIFLRQKAEGKKLTIIGDGEQRRDFTNVEDVVKANILAAHAENKLVVGELINIGSGQNYSVLEVAEMIGAEHTFVAPRLGEARESLANIQKAKSLLKWNPTVKLVEWLKDR